MPENQINFALNYFVLFLIISFGLIRGISLDVSAVIFVVLVLCHFGVTISAEIQTIGLLLFIITIGIGAQYFLRANYCAHLLNLEKNKIYFVINL